MWVRGLKHEFRYLTRKHAMSHPMWVRGLKLKRSAYDNIAFPVAPYVGAWIETFNSAAAQRKRLGRTLCGCVD